MTPSDPDLVRAARAGDAIALGMLLERHRARMHAVALAMLGHGPPAEDAVQDAFMVALRHIEDLRDPEAAGAWLRGITRNVCLTRIRERRPATALGDRLAATTGPTPEEVVDGLALRDWVWTAIEALSEPLRVTAMLRYFSRTPSYEEVALICGVPMGTVRSRLSQVNVKLGQALLDTAAAAHHDAAALTASRRRHFTQAFAEYNDAIGCDLYVEACTADVEIGAAGTPAPSRGRAAVAAELEGDIEAGVRFGLDQVIAGAGVTILRGGSSTRPGTRSTVPRRRRTSTGTTATQSIRSGCTSVPAPRRAERGPIATLPTPANPPRSGTPSRSAPGPRCRCSTRRRTRRGRRRTPRPDSVNSDEYSPSRRNSSPTSPGFAHPSASRRVRSLYSAEKRRRRGRSTSSGSGTLSAASCARSRPHCSCSPASQQTPVLALKHSRNVLVNVSVELGREGRGSVEGTPCLLSEASTADPCWLRPRYR